MALIALTKPHHSRVNVPFGANNTTAAILHQFTVWALKAFLMNQHTSGTVGATLRHVDSVWVCLGSSDGVVGALDAVDRWGAAFDASKIVMNSSGNAHAWIVLRSVALGYDICIDVNSATPGTLGIIATKSTTPFAGGSNTVRPQTAANAEEFVCGVNGAPTASSAVTLFTDVTTLTTRWAHFVCDNAGSFYFFSTRTGGSNSTLVALLPAVGGHGSDTRNLWWLKASGAGVAGAGVPTPSSFAGGTGLSRRNWDAGASNAGFGLRPPQYSNTTLVVGSYPHAFTGEYPVLEVEVGALNTGVGTTSLPCGKIPDIYLTTSNIQAASIPTLATMQWTSLGCLIIPCEVTPTT